MLGHVREIVSTTAEVPHVTVIAVAGLYVLPRKAQSVVSVSASVLPTLILVSMLHSPFFGLH